MISAPIIKGALIAAFTAFAVLPVRAAEIPAKPEAGTLVVGVQPWLGYGPLHIAAEKGLYKKAGLSKVKIENFVEQKDINAAVASGALDVAAVPTNAALSMKAAGLPIKIVALLDISTTADAILSGPDITSIKDLKGKKVAYEQGATSDVLLQYALLANGLSIKDIEPVPMPAANAGGALIAGQVPVAVTYEPYLSTAMQQDSKLKLLYTAGVNPGLISDVLVVREDVLKKRPGQILALIKAWDAALKDYNADVAGGRAIIAKAVGASVDELKTAFDGVVFYSMVQNKDLLPGSFSGKTLGDVADASQKAGLLEKPVAAGDVVVVDFVKAVP